ncbi:MAG: rod shape-determining protein MreC [Anaerolineales bacterium]|nr:rod shape-determining protein MreC [Anaerolineales bacterium]
MKIRNSQRWISIALGLVVVGILVLALGGYLSAVGDFVLGSVLQAQEWLTVRFQTFQDFYNAPTDLVRLRQENAELQAEVAKLQTEVIDLQQQVSEVELLTALLEFARGQRENEYMAASVVFRDPRPFLKYVVIDVGSDDGILAGMPVVGPEGLVGRVDAVTANAARVQLVTDPDSSVNVRIQPSDTTAVLLGSITSDLSLDLIPIDATINAGDLVLTSGLGGNFPANILVGQVASVRSSATSLFQQAAIQPAVDLNRLDIVLVVVNFQPIDTEPLIPEITEGQ